MGFNSAFKGLKKGPFLPVARESPAHCLRLRNGCWLRNFLFLRFGFLRKRRNFSFLCPRSFLVWSQHNFETLDGRRESYLVYLVWKRSRTSVARKGLSEHFSNLQIPGRILNTRSYTCGCSSTSLVRKSFTSLSWVFIQRGPL